MKLTRRSLLEGVLLAAGAAAARADEAQSASTPVLLVYDSRLSASRALQLRHRGEAIDVAQEHTHRWSALRSHKPLGPIIGFTRWSDLVQARALFEPQRLRLRVTERRDGLFYWEMS